jgi:IclR family transcriptional regulator, KDG regulon repressor
MKNDEESRSPIDKATKILMAFTPHNEELGTRALGKELGLHAATVNRILNLLIKPGFIQKNPTTKKYRLGSAIIELGKAVTNSFNIPIRSLAEPYMRELTNITGENTALLTLVDNGIIMSLEIESPSHIKLATFPIGAEVPWHSSAGARAIIAFLPQAQQKTYFRKKREAFTKYTATDINILKRQLKEIREKGVSHDDRGRWDDVMAIAAPVFNHEEIPVASIVVVGPAYRLQDRPENEIIPHLLKTAELISERLLFRKTENSIERI